MTPRLSFRRALLYCMNIALCHTKSIQQPTSIENSTSSKNTRTHKTFLISLKLVLNSDTENNVGESHRPMLNANSNKTLHQEGDESIVMAKAAVGGSKQAEVWRYKDESEKDTRDLDKTLDVIAAVNSSETSVDASGNKTANDASGLKNNNESTSKFTSGPDDQSPTIVISCVPEDDEVFRPLTNLSGQIEWTLAGETANCSQSINVHSSRGDLRLGLVIHFLRLDLRRGSERARDDVVHVYEGLVRADEGSVRAHEDSNGTAGKELRRVHGSLPVSPVLVYSGQVTLRLTAYKLEENRTGRSRRPLRSSFSVRWRSYPVDTLPPRLGQGPAGPYNCSPPYLVPTALRCDGVRQCQDGQDETDYGCSQGHGPCDPGWTQHMSICFLFVFPERPLSHVDAVHRCKSDYEADLGELPGPDLKQFVARIASPHGHHEVIVNLKRFQSKADVKKLDTGNIMYQLYRFSWTWYKLRWLELSGPPLRRQRHNEHCAVLRTIPYHYFKSVSCLDGKHAGYVCMKGEDGVFRYKSPSSEIQLCQEVQTDLAEHLQLDKCDDGSFVELFSNCRGHSRKIHRKRNERIRRFNCNNNEQVPYTKICDGNEDCVDFSDEHACEAVDIVITYNRVTPNAYICVDQTMPVLTEDKCDGKIDCREMDDEENCLACTEGLRLYPLGCLPPQYTEMGIEHFMSDVTHKEDDLPADRHILMDNEYDAVLKIVNMDGYGSSTIDIANQTRCPDTHFECPGKACIPIFLYANLIGDCPHSYNGDIGRIPFFFECPGYYRCRESYILLHPAYYCDGVAHCPHRDDELYCRWTCPEGCVCHGLEYTCKRSLDAGRYPLVRYLDMSGVWQPQLDLLENAAFLHFLNISFCNLTTVVYNVWVVAVLDMSHNKIHSLNDSMVNRGGFLRYLNVSNNPLVSYLSLDSLDTFLCTVHDSLTWLSLSNTGLRSIATGTFGQMSILKYLDISKNRLENPEVGIFHGLPELIELSASEERLCCMYRHLYKHQILCKAPADELSSCANLLRSSVLRFTLWVQSFMALMGNGGVFVFRLFLDSHPVMASSFRVLVTHLSVADAVMGVYLVVIGSADAHFLDVYLWERDRWTDSAVCHAAGFLALLSSEVSALLIILITLDRLLMLRFPFRSQLHMTPRSAQLSGFLAWALGLALASVPLLPGARHWRFYSQTGICLPLPITSRQFPGQDYASGIFLGLNFSLFVLIGLGQLAVYLVIRGTPDVGRQDRRQQDMAIARRLFFVALSDFCCWFPIGVMGLLAARGTPIPGEVNAWAAAFLLPLNSALNPFVYTLNAYLAKRRRRRRAEQLKAMLKRLVVDIKSWPKVTVAQIYRSCEAAMAKFGNESGAVDNPA